METKSDNYRWENLLLGVKLRKTTDLRRARINSILPEDLILLDDEGKEIEMSKK